MRAEIQMRRGHLFWAKNRLASAIIDLQALFNDYWGSNKDEFTVRVSHDHTLARSYLIAKRRRHYCRWKAPPASLVSRITILCKHYCVSLCDWSLHPANNSRMDGISALVAPSTRRHVEGVLSTDERIDRKSCGEGY